MSAPPLTSGLEASPPSASSAGVLDLMEGVAFYLEPPSTKHRTRSGPGNGCCPADKDEKAEKVLSLIDGGT